MSSQGTFVLWQPGKLRQITSFENYSFLSCNICCPSHLKPFNIHHSNIFPTEFWLSLCWLHNIRHKTTTNCTWDTCRDTIAFQWCLKKLMGSTPYHVGGFNTYSCSSSWPPPILFKYLRITVAKGTINKIVIMTTQYMCPWQ